MYNKFVEFYWDKVDYPYPSIYCAFFKKVIITIQKSTEYDNTLSTQLIVKLHKRLIINIDVGFTP